MQVVFHRSGISATSPPSSQIMLLVCNNPYPTSIKICSVYKKLFVHPSL